MNKMTQMSVNKLLINVSLPIMLALFIQALYTIVDSIFIANYSESALASISLVYPISMMIISLSVGLAIGMGACLAKSLGEKKNQEANNILIHGIIITLIVWFILALITLLFAKEFFLQFSDDLTIVNQAYRYAIITTVFGFGIFVQIMLERVFQATGYSILNLKMQIVGTIINIILDPILIFGLGFIPSLGIIGAAIATVLGQIIGCLYGFRVIKKQVNEVSITLHDFSYDPKIVKRIFDISLSAILVTSISTFMMVGMNYILALESELAISVFSIYIKLQQFVFMPIFGLSNATLAIVSYNYGANLKDRMIDTVHSAIKITISIMITGTILFQLFNVTALNMFKANTLMLEIGKPLLIIISYSFVFAGISLIYSSVLQAINKSIYSLINTLIRGLILPLVLSYFIYLNYGLNYIWYSFIIAEVIGAIYIYYIYQREIKKI